MSAAQIAILHMAGLHPVGITGCQCLLGREIAVLAFGDRVELLEVVLPEWHIILTIEVRISPDEQVVLGFPGPDRSIRLENLQAGRAVSRRYRNRRIGEFLKELDLTEGRATGIPKILRVMADNGSPAPVFETDDERTSFVIRLPRHPLAQEPSPATAEVTMEVTMEVAALLKVVQCEMSRQELQAEPTGAQYGSLRLVAAHCGSLRLITPQMRLRDAPVPTAGRSRTAEPGGESRQCGQCRRMNYAGVS